jgi:hypothetical protein
MHPQRLIRLHREGFPTEHRDKLVPFLLDITGRSVAQGLPKVVLRKLFVAVRRPSLSQPFRFSPPFVDHAQLSALALRLVPQDTPRWPDWIITTATALSSAGASTEHILDFLEIVVEEVNGADLLPTKRCDLTCLTR